MHPTSNVLSQAPAAPWYTHRWPWLLMLGPVLVMLATAVTVWFALQTPDAMVVDDYYKQGKAINQDLRRDRVASSMGLSLSAAYDAAAGRLEGTLTSLGEPMVAPFRIRLAHPTQPAKDLVLEALPDGRGRFTAALPSLEQTHWQVVVEGGARDWRLASSWSPHKQRTLEIEADVMQ